MGEASASAAATSGLQQSGGTINVNQPNYLPWIVGGVVLAVLAFFFAKKKGWL